MRVLIVDDEPLARRRLARLLTLLPEVELVGEADDGTTAATLIRERAPDVLLLDIDMPGQDGLALARLLAGKIPIVFTTAHRKHAVDAFELQAIDYLLKPIEEARLREALARAGRARAAAGLELRALELALRAALQSSAPLRLAARHGERVELLDPGSVTRLFASDKYTLCVREGLELVLDESLNALETRLASTGFLRVHRRELINLHHVRALRYEPVGALLELSDGQRAEVSRRALPELRRRLGM